MSDKQRVLSGLAIRGDEKYNVILMSTQETTNTGQPAEPNTLVHNELHPEVPGSPARDGEGGEAMSQSQALARANLANSMAEFDEPKADPGESSSDERKLIPEDFVYPDEHREGEAEESPSPSFLTSFMDCQGVDSEKRFNFHIIDDENLIYASGTFFVVYDLYSKVKKVYNCRDGGGIGAITIAPGGKLFAVLEKGKFPNVYIYQYPSIKLYRVLRKGTQKSYSSGSFSRDASLFATVGSSPDYLMCIWDWKQETVLLKAKAFSQEVYRVTFSEYNNEQLTTSGMGHIKMWKIAETFTGLKLKGELAKFGQFQLSDVSSYFQFEDGKVLSSSEYGNLLLWEGNLIKCVLFIEEGVPCHNGPIQVVMKHQGSRAEIVSAGKDGFIRFWDLGVIDKSESDEKFNFYIKPLKEVYLQFAHGVPAHILSLDFNGRFWIIQDQRGKVYKTSSKEIEDYELVLETNSGRISDIGISPINNSCVTIGKDGALRLWDLGNGREYYNRVFETRSQGTCLEWCPYSKRNGGRMLAAGFSDGVVRFLLLEADKFFVLKALKVHKNGIAKVKFSPDGGKVIAVSEEGDIFFLSYEGDLQDIKPYCLYETKFKINDLCWNKSGTALLVGTSLGTIHEFEVPNPSLCDVSETYLREPVMRSYTIMMMESQKPKKEDLELEMILKKTKRGAQNEEEKKEDEEWEPAPILNLAYYDMECNKVVCAVDGKFLGFLYVVEFGKQRPLSNFAIAAKPTSFLATNEHKDLFLIGYKGGFWELRSRVNTDMYFRRQSHDQDYGRVSGVCLNMDKNLVVTAGEDGTIVVYKVDFNNFLKTVRTQIEPQPGSLFFPSVVQGISDINFMDTIAVKEGGERDLLDANIYSIQEEKLKAEEDHKRALANKTKQNRLNEIAKIRKEYEDILKLNEATDQAIRFSPEELVVDREYELILHQRVEEDLEETRKELKWETEYYNLALYKIKRYMIEDLESHRFGVRGVKRTDLRVESFKLKKTSPRLEEMIRQEKLEIEQELREKEAELALRAQSMQLLEPESDFKREIRLAEVNKGDYKLKSDKNYVVPEDELMNVKKKRRHILLLFEFICRTKREFNSRLLGLLHRKKNIIRKTNEYNEKISEINATLGLSSDEWKIEMDEELEIESADDMFQLGEKEVEEAFKAKYKKALEVVRKEEKKEKVREKLPVVKPRVGMKVQRSELEEETREIERMVLQSAKRRMQEELEEELARFDRELLELRGERLLTQGDLVMSEMKMVTYNQELTIFADMENEDMKYIREQMTLKEEKHKLEASSKSLEATVAELSRSLKDLEKKLEEENKLLAEFIFPDDRTKREEVVSYFRKKEKNRLNSKKNKKFEEANEEEEEEEDLEDEDLEDEDEEKPDLSCVETGDNKNMDIIKKIIDYGFKIDDTNNNLKELNKNRAAFNNKVERIKVELNRAETNLREFQLQKLKKVNQLDVTFPIRLDQVVIAPEERTLPKDLRRYILFTRENLSRLERRIEDLKQEKNKISVEKGELKTKNGKLQKMVNNIEKVIAEKKKEEREKKLLKFGDEVDLEYIKCLKPSDQLLELERQFKKEEAQIGERIAEAQREVAASKKRLLEVKKENTGIIVEITKLGQKQMQLNKKLDSTNKALFKEENEDKKNGLEKERQNIEDLIKFLEREIEDLKKEIGLFKRKGGHIYTMVTSSNRRNFQ